MNNISSLIEVFRMDELSPDTRISIVEKLGRAINDSFGMNITEPIVEELVNILREKKAGVNLLDTLWFIMESPDYTDEMRNSASELYSYTERNLSKINNKEK